MDAWIKEALGGIDRKKAQILFGEHAAKDKNLDFQDVDNAVETVRVGKIDEWKSTAEKQRICFKNYFVKKGYTYFVIVEFCPDFMKIVTVIKKKGKY